MQSVEEVQPAALTPTSSPEQFLRALFYRGDMALIVRDAGAIANQPGASLESRAWYFSETIQQNSFDKALPVLDGMEKEAADDPWTLAAKAMLARDLELAIWLCERAVARSDRDDVLLLCARFLPLKVSEIDKAKGAAQGEVLKAFLERYDKRLEGLPTDWPPRAMCCEPSTGRSTRAMPTMPRTMTKRWKWTRTTSGR